MLPAQAEAKHGAVKPTASLVLLLCLSTLPLPCSVLVAIWVLLLTARICGRYTGNPINRVRWCVACMLCAGVHASAEPWLAARRRQRQRQRQRSRHHATSWAGPHAVLLLAVVLAIPMALPSTFPFHQFEFVLQDGGPGAELHRSHALLLPHAHVRRGSKALPPPGGLRSRLAQLLSTTAAAARRWRAYPSGSKRNAPAC